MKTGGAVILMMAGAICWILFQTSCQHAPIIDPNDMNQDTSGMDTTVMDTPIVKDSCDPNFVYFQQQVLPIFQSNCATSGCHDANTAQEGVILNSYDNIVQTGEVEPFDLTGSKIWERITEDDPDKRMPPPPASRLPSSTIALIEKWILQGATDSACVEQECITENMSFANDISPIFSTYCYSCHTGSAPSGGIDLSAYTDVKTVADAGTLFCAISHSQGCTPMPLGGNMIPECDIMKIKSWIDNGAPNN